MSSTKASLWIDRDDWESDLTNRIEHGAIPGALENAYRHFHDKGYVTFPAAVDPDKAQGFCDFFDSIWDCPPADLQCVDGSKVVPVTPEHREKRAKVIDLHRLHPGGYELLFPEIVKQFLTGLYAAPPVAFQSMSFRHGSQQGTHLDTAYLPLTDSATLTASWLALEDIQPGSGELFYYEGSHRMVRPLFGGVSEVLKGYEAHHGEFLQELEKRCIEGGYPKKTFLPKKGDVLVWSAYLAHGGGPVTNHESLRRSFVSHFMPLGVIPVFYDLGQRKPVECISGGYHLDGPK